MLSCVPIVVPSLAAQLDDELLGRAFQGGGAIFAALSAAACKPATELAGGGDDQVRKGIVRQRGEEFVPLGAGQARGQHVDAVVYRRFLVLWWR